VSAPIDPLKEWAQHWPFTRASAALQRRVAQALRDRKHSAPRAPL
jgi:hypothetical protein